MTPKNQGVFQLMSLKLYTYSNHISNIHLFVKIYLFLSFIYILK